jgi:hypothetical protein
MGRETDMDAIEKTRFRWLALVASMAALGVLTAVPSRAQVPVDEDGNPVEAIDETGEAARTYPLEAAAEENLSIDELQALVGPIALYPDDLLAIVLPASAYPLQIVQAARFLEDLEQDSSLEPDESWDESVTALLNYPEVIEMLNEDLDWTYELGEAVVRQQADVIAAVEAFRDRAYAAGNLKTDDRQTVTQNEGVIEIEPVEEEVIYVPYYEPERVVVYQPQPVYHYYPRPYPVYYYPYPYGHSFASGYFWGVTTAFSIGWFTDHLHVFHHSYWGHPYYGRHYYHPWYRRPSINIYNTFYVDNHVRRPRQHERDGDFWRPRRHSGALLTRNRFREAYYSDRRRERTEEGYRNRGGDERQIASGTRTRAGLRGDRAGAAEGNGDRAARFASSRSRDEARRDDRNREAPAVRRDAADGSDDGIRFRPRERAGTARRADDGDASIRFRARERTEERATDRSDNATRVTPPGIDRNSRPPEPRRPSSARRDSTPTPAVRERATSRGDSSGADRRVTPAPRATTRAPAVRSRASTPRAVPELRTSRPAAASPRAPAQAPRTADVSPRAPAQAPRTSRPADASPRAPARESRAAPRRAVEPAGTSERRRHRP